MLVAMRISLLVLLALGGVMSQGCARILQAAYDPSGVAQGLGADTVSDLDRILAAHPDADNAEELRGLRQQASQGRRLSSGSSAQAQAAARQDHAAEHDRHRQASRPPPDRFVVQAPGSRRYERGSEDRRGDSGVPWSPQVLGTPRRFP